MKKVILIALVCVMAVAALAGCGGTNGGSAATAAGNGVVGKWNTVGTDQSIVFELKEDGTFRSTDKGSDETRMDGTYTVEGDHISFYWGEKKWKNF